MTLSLGNITFDCEDARRVGDFWASALGREVDEGASEFFTSIGRIERGDGPAWFFLKVPEGKSVKNRVHVDLTVDGDRSAEVERLVGLGATHVADKEEWGFAWSVLTDVEGNEFCIGGGH